MSFIFSPNKIIGINERFRFVKNRFSFLNRLSNIEGFLFLKPHSFTLSSKTKMKNIPTLYEWSGGKDTLEKLTKVFYDKVFIGVLYKYYYGFLYYAAYKVGYGYCVCFNF